MFSIFWIFTGAIVGLLLVAVFAPPARKDVQVPTPYSKAVYRTPSGCVKFKTTKVACSDESTSLNLLASSHK
jgi:hypothetical protein